MPNLVRTLENNPAFIHGGPFENIAHGCNSVMTTLVGFKLVDHVVTEAGFRVGLGAEKFFDIKCQRAGLRPDGAVVATICALKTHGGVATGDLGSENVDAVRSGLAKLDRHLDNIARFGVPTVVGVNRFTTDTDAELDAVREYCEARCAVARDIYPWCGGSDYPGDRPELDHQDRGGRLRPISGVNGKDPVQLHDRSEREVRPFRSLHPRPQGAPFVRHRVPRRRPRRHGDHARPPSRPRHQQHPPRLRRRRRGPVLNEETFEIFYPFFFTPNKTETIAESDLGRKQDYEQQEEKSCQQDA